MLNGLAGYLFGGRTDNGVPAAGRVTPPSPAGRAPAPPALVDEEDCGWILVDNETELDLVALPSSTESSGSPSPVTTTEALGWNLTPPPCFTASQQQQLQQQQQQQQRQLSDSKKSITKSPSENRPAGTVAKIKLSTADKNNNNGTPADRRRTGDDGLQPMEISVFENLLIEHPSMSVYNNRRRPPAGAAASTTVNNNGRRSKCRWPIITTPLSMITQGAPTTTSSAADTDEAPAAVTVVESPPQVSQGVRLRSVVDDFMHFFGGATCRMDVLRAATAAQQRVERAAKGRDYGTNRMKRQNTTTTATATTADGTKVAQRKRRMRKHSGRSNDRKCQ